VLDQRREDGDPHFTEIGFGSSSSRPAIKQGIEPWMTEPCGES
jgi:hypothetical protein